MHIYMYTCMLIYQYVYIYTCISIYIYTYAQIHTHILSLTHTHTRTNIYLYTYTCTQVLSHVTTSLRSSIKHLNDELEGTRTSLDQHAGLQLGTATEKNTQKSQLAIHLIPQILVELTFENIYSYAMPPRV